MPSDIQAALIDAYPLFRDGVREALARTSDIKVIAEGSSVTDALRIAQTLSPDLILIDIDMPGGGVAAIVEVAKVLPDIKVVILTASEHECDVSAAIAAGVQGYVLKGISGAELVDIVRAIHGGQSYFTPALAAGMLRRRLQAEQASCSAEVCAQLTAREDQILKQVSQGLSNKEIARKLNISDKTVKHYMTLIMQKMHVRNRVEAVLQHQQRWRLE